MKFTEEHKARARELKSQGMTNAAIAREIGCHRTSVGNWLKEMQPKSDALVPVYASEELIMPEIVLHRYHQDDVRRYYSLEPFNVYVGVTSALGETMPMDHGLKVYMCSFRDYEHYSDELAKLADFGTLYHILAGDIAWKGLSLDTLSDRMASEAMDLGRSESWGRGHTRRMYKFLLSFQQFVYDKEVEFLGIELPIVIPEYGVGSCIDFVLRLTFNRKRTLAILDLKSGSGTYPSYQAQLKAYEVGLRLTYPQFKDEPIMLFNLNPVDWQTKPTYKLTNQTGKFDLKRLDGYLRNLKYHVRIKPEDVLRFSGELGPGSNPQDHFQWNTFEEIILERNSQ